MRRIDPAKKHFSGRPLPVESSSRAKDVIHSRVDSSKYTVDMKSGNSRKGYNFVVDPNLELGSENGKLSELKASHAAKSTSVTIEDIPSAVGLSQLIEAISVFGEISGTFMKTGRNGLDYCVVNYEVNTDTSWWPSYIFGYVCFCVGVEI